MSLLVRSHPSLVVSSPIANSASFRLYTHASPLAFPTTSHSHSGVSILTGSRGCCCCCSYCCRRAGHPHSVPPVFKTASHPACTVDPIWKIWLELRLVSRKPHGGYWVPLQLHSRSLPRCTCSSPPSPTHLDGTRDQGVLLLEEAMRFKKKLKKIVVSVQHFL